MTPTSATTSAPAGSDDPGARITSIPAAAAGRGPIAADARVLAGRPLHRSVKLEETATYGADVWSLSPAMHRADHHALKLNFTTIPKPFREVTKQLCYAMLTGDLPPGELLVSVETVRKIFGCLKRFVIWVSGRGDRLGELSASDLVEYHVDVVETRLALSSKIYHRRACTLFWLYRTKLTADQLSQDPRQLPQWQAWDRTHTGQAKPSAENSTPRIPEPVIGPLLTWALRWIDDFADDVLSARDDHLRVRFRQAAADGPAIDALRDLLDQYRRRRRPLPSSPRQARVGGRAARGGRPNVDFLTKRIGRTSGNLDSAAARTLLDAAIRDVGVDDDSYLDIEIHGRLDGRPWMAAISYYDTGQLVRLLQTACWIVIAYLSGMRDSEVKHLQRGCLTVMRDTTGRPYRRQLHSLAFKGEAPEGTPATWVVGAPVERAVTVLERLQPSTQRYLFALNPCSWQINRDGRDPDRVIQSNTTIEYLNEFVSWINDYCTRHQRADRIPDGPMGSGRPPKLTTRQFRRTLAWFIARRPGGAIAGAIQYRHQHIQMFEGYAGTSASGFRDEVEAEQALARGQFLADMGLELEADQLRLTGPAAQEAAQRLAEFARHATREGLDGFDGFGGFGGFEGKVIIDEARLRRVLARHDPQVYPGTFVTCTYNADRALCRSGHDPLAGPNGAVSAESAESAESVELHGEPQGPALAACQPLACRNVALTNANRDALAEHVTRIEQLLTTNVGIADRLPPYQRHRLEQQRAEITGFLDRHIPAQVEPPGAAS